MIQFREQLNSLGSAARASGVAGFEMDAGRLVSDSRWKLLSTPLFPRNICADGLEDVGQLPEEFPFSFQEARMAPASLSALDYTDRASVSFPFALSVSEHHTRQSRRYLIHTHEGRVCGQLRQNRCFADPVFAMHLDSP
jgi:hypothetical protein